MEIIIYHGSNVEYPDHVSSKMDSIKILDTDFVAQILKSKRNSWAMSRKGKTVVNYYKYKPDKN